MKDYNAFLAMIISPIAIIFGIFCLVGCSSTNNASTGIYQLQLDFTNVNFTKLIYLPHDDGITSSLTLEDAGISQIYRIGLNGFCRGTRENGSIKFDSCVRNFSPDPALMLVKDIRKRGVEPLRHLSILSISFPYDVADFSEEPYRSNSRSCIYTTIIGVILAGFAMVFYVLNVSLPSSKQLFTFGAIFTLLSFLCFFVAALVSIGIFNSVKNNFNAKFHIYGKADSFWGIDASLGTAFYVLIWLSFGVQFLWSISVWIIGWRNLGNKVPQYKSEDQVLNNMMEPHSYIKPRS